MDERKQSALLFGYRFFYVFLVCALGYLSLREQMQFRDMVLLHLFVLAVLSAGVSAVDSLKGRNYLYGVMAFVAVYALIVLGQGRPSEEPASGRIFFRETLILMLMALGVYLAHLFAEKFVWLKRAAAILLLAGLVTAMVCEWQIPHLGVAAALLYMAAVLTEAVESRWKKQKQGSVPAYLLWLLPFLAGYFLLAAVTPHQDTPYDWAFFVQMYERVQEKVITYAENLIHAGEEDFGISTTGFSDESGFFGSPEKKDRTVIRVSNPYRYVGSVYLTGKCYDSFDGRQWEQNAQSDEDCFSDTLRTLCAVYQYDGEYPKDYLRERYIGVEYRYFHTGCLFAPLKACRIEPADSRTEFSQMNGSFCFSKKQGYGTKYQMAYYQLNQENPVFEDFVLAAGEPEPESFARAAKEVPGAAEGVTLQELAERQERVKREYTKDVDLSPEVERFWQEALAGADTDYEKLLRLERALCGLSYNVRPGRLPGEVDTEKKFLDYFLVDSREGYCSYFASAFVLLARKAGIPARYVQGYVVPLEGRTSVEVTGSMAHAWPEAWLDGIGWLPFEPTPGFYERGRVSWETHRREDPGDAAQKEGAGNRKPVDEIAEEESLEDLEAQLRLAERARRREILRYLGCFLLILLGLGIALLSADAVLEKKREAKRSLGERFRLEAARNLQILSALGYRRHSSETLSELSRRVSLGHGSDLEGFFAMCEAILYGEALPDEGKIAKLRLVRGELLKKLREQKGKSYLFCRIGLYLMRAR